MSIIFGQAIRAKRKRHGITIPQLAKALGVSTGHVSNVERGKSGPFTEDQCMVAAKMFDMPFQSLWIVACAHITAAKHGRELGDKVAAAFADMPQYVRETIAALTMIEWRNHDPR